MPYAASAQGLPMTRGKRIPKDAGPCVHLRLARIDQTIHEPQKFVIVAPGRCRTDEQWEANVKAGKYSPYAQGVVK